MSDLPANTIQKAYIVRGGMPRMITPELAWVGGCSDSAGWPGMANKKPVTHEPCCAFVILGSEKTLMLDPGHYGLWYSLDGQLDAVLQGRQLDYVFPSHQEIPHTGNLGRILAKYPNCVAVGNVEDYHLFHPEVELDRLQPKKHGDKISLGDRDFIFLDAIWKDLTGTMWGYETKQKLIATADGFGFIHLHDENVCGTLPHEMQPAEFKAVIERTAIPFYGLRNRDQTVRVAAFRNLMAKYPIEIICSGHCGPIMGPALQPAIDKLLTKIADPKEGAVFLHSQNSTPHSGSDLMA